MSIKHEQKEMMIRFIYNRVGEEGKAMYGTIKYGGREGS